MEEERAAALEMAQEEDEAPEESPAAAKEVGLKAFSTLVFPGAWGSQGSSRAPVINRDECQRVC